MCTARYALCPRSSCRTERVGAKLSSDAGSLAKLEKHFGYIREVVGDRDAILEFETEIEGISVNGVEMIRWSEAGLIEDFKVMIRPLKAIQKIPAQIAACSKQ